MAWPLCWMEVLAFAKELIITSYVGHLGAAELSALVLAQTVYNVTGEHCARGGGGGYRY